MLYIYIYIHLLANTPSHSSIFRTKNWVKINYGAQGTYSTSITFTAAKTAASDVAANSYNIKVIFNNCTPLPDCLSEITYRDHYSKTLGSL